jgi:hypothetical protein
MKMGSVDLMICQGSSSDSIPYFQVGRDGQMNSDQPEELTEQVGSKKNLDQQMQLTEEEHHNDLLMIGELNYSYHLPRRRPKILLYMQQQ